MTVRRLHRAALGAGAAAAVAAGLVLVPAADVGGQICGGSWSAAGLVARFGEFPVGRGLTGSRSIYELWVDPIDRSWTVVRVDLGGQLCVVLAGSDWDFVRPLTGRRL